MTSRRAIDSNVLIRIAVADDAKQVETIGRLLLSLGAEETLRVSLPARNRGEALDHVLFVGPPTAPG